MNAAIVQTLLTGSGARGAPARDSAPAEEAAQFRDALSLPGDGNQRRGGDADGLRPFGRLAERLAETMGPLRTERVAGPGSRATQAVERNSGTQRKHAEHTHLAEAAEADTPDDLAGLDALETAIDEKTGKLPDDASTVAADDTSTDRTDAGDGDKAAAPGAATVHAATQIEASPNFPPVGRPERSATDAADPAAQPEDAVASQQRSAAMSPLSRQAQASAHASAGDPGSVPMRTGSNDRGDDATPRSADAAAQKPASREQTRRQESGAAPVSAGSAPDAASSAGGSSGTTADQPSAAARPAPADGRPVTIVDAGPSQPPVNRTGEDVAAAVGRSLVMPAATEPGAADVRATPRPSDELPAAEAAATEGGEPSQAHDGARPPDSAQAAEEDAAPLSRADEESASASPARADAAAVPRGAEPAPAPLRPSVTAASLLGPLTSDPLLRSALAAPTAASAPQEAARPAHSLRIQLRPVELGSVTATLRMTDDGLSVEMTTENLDAYRQLTKESDTIVAALRGIGLQVDQVTIQPPQPASAASTRNDGGAAMQNGAGRGDGFGAAGSSGGNAGSRSGNHSNEGDRDGASVRSSAAPAANARTGGSLVI